MSQRHKYLIAISAAVLLISACTIAPDAGAPLLFVVPFTAGMLWVLGVTRTPRFVKQKRRAARGRPRRLAEPNRQATPREFLEQPKWWARAMLFVTGLVPFVLGLLCFAAIFGPTTTAETWGALVVFGVALTLFGGFFLRFAKRLPIMGVRVDEQGLEATGILGVRRIAWDDIVAVCDKLYRMRGIDYQTNHLVYAMDAMIEINGKMPHASELLEIVRQNAPPDAWA